MFRKAAALFCLMLLVTANVEAATLRVPEDYPSIQSAVDAANADDTVLVAAGRYTERVRLKAGIVLRSSGTDDRGEIGLRRAEQTILDGNGGDDDMAGVVMAEGSVLDGFTITNVGMYNDAEWQKHFGSHGEELGDDEGAVHAEGTIPAIRISAVDCRVTNCIVHHNGDVGIGIVGAEHRIVAPIIQANTVYRNMGGGIGVAENAAAIIRANTCYENLRAGIGCRRASPIIVGNECQGNVRAGIGCRESAKPVIRANRCFRNRRAGIGIRMKGTVAVVEGNECFENAMAGIGCRDGASSLLTGNTCRDNQLVAIGVTEGADALIRENVLVRASGVPPIIAVKDHSSAIIQNNQISGGGVAAVLIQGRAIVSGNEFTAIAEKPGTGVWVRSDSTVTMMDNTFRGYRTAVKAEHASVTVSRNQIHQFQGTAILLKDCIPPVFVSGNTATSNDAKAKVVEIPGTAGTVENNTLNPDKP